MAKFVLDFDNLIAFCERQQLRYKRNDETGQIAVLHRVLDRDAPIYLIPYLSRHMVALILPLPFRVTPQRLPYVGEAVTRLNGAAHMGTWVLNVETGEVYFRVTLPSLDAEYGDEGLLFVSRLVVSTAEAAAKGLERIALGEGSFADIFRPLT